MKKTKIIDKLKQRRKKKGFTLVELVVVILIIAVLASATFLGGATVIKQARKTKAVNDLRNYSSYLEDMFYGNPGYGSKEFAETGGVIAEAMNEYLTTDLQVVGDGKTGESISLKDAWDNAYNYAYYKNPTATEAAVLVWSNGPDQVSGSSLTSIEPTIVGDDIAVLVKMVNGEVSTLTSDSLASGEAGGVETEPSSPLASISITTEPTNKYYEPGQDFDSTGMVVKYTLDDGTNDETTDYTIIGGTSMTEGQAFVTISYTKDDVTQTVTQQIVVREIIKATVVEGIITSDWNTLKTVSQEIENDNNVTSATTDLTEKYGLKVGDKIKVDSLTCYIAGFNHDVTHDEKGITLVANSGKTFCMNHDQTNAGGWNSSVMRLYMDSAELTNDIPTIVDAAKLVKKTSDAGNKDKTTIKTTEDKLWLLSFEEVGFTLAESTNFVPGQGTVYPLFKEGVTEEALKCRTDLCAPSWWLRSADTHYKVYFWGVDSYGCYNYSADLFYGVVFGFCI